MFVRAFDAHTGEYYKSMVYARINSGMQELAVLYHPVLDSFVIQPRVRCGEGRAPELLYECIQPGQSGWVAGDPRLMAGLHTAPAGEKGTSPVTRLWGYPEVVGDTHFLQVLLSTGFVPGENTVIRRREPADSQAWTYVNTQDDAGRLMERFNGFRNATLDRLFYKENTGTRQLTARFSNRCGGIDLCFEGMLSLRLVPAAENAGREISEACLLVRDEAAYWADAALEQEDLSAAHNHIKALNLKWRLLNSQRRR